MYRGTKIATVAGVTIIVTAAVLCFGLFCQGNIKSEEAYTSEYDWQHGIKSVKNEYTTDENLLRTYALIPYDKEKFAEMDSHTFIGIISPILGLYRSRQWNYATFVFADGTGLYFPDSNINESALYGEINEKGLITSTYGVLSISGTKIEYSEMVSAFTSQTSKSLLSYMPEEYLSDDLSALIEDNVMYIVFYAPFRDYSENGTIILTTPDEEQCRAVVEDFYSLLSESGCEYIDSCDAVYIALSNNGMGFSITKDGNAIYSAELGRRIFNIIHLSESCKNTPSS